MTINVGEVGMISIDSVIIGERARQEMGNLIDLESNLKSSGLIQPLAVKRLDNEKFQLLAGERRYTILLKNQVQIIPVRIYNEDLTDLEMKMIEKSENFYRKDMEYWEYDKLVYEIDQLQKSIKGASAPGPGHGGHKLKDTADMFGVTEASVSTAIKRAEAREAFPELFEHCKTQKDASTIIKKVSGEIVKDTIARKLEQEKCEGTILSKLSNAYVLGSFFEGVKKIPDEVINFIEIDPPYSIKLKDVKKSDGESMYSKASYNEITEDIYIEGHPDPAHSWRGIRALFQECYRVMTNHSWLICWFAPEPWFEVIYKELIDAGFKTTRMCGIWSKPSGQSNSPTTRLANSYEMFFYAWKGQPVLNKAGSINSFKPSPVPPNQKTHPTERPVELMKDIYETFTFPGSRVLIPFLGSGNGLISAYELGMNPIGFELSKSYRDSFLVKVNEMR